MSDLKKRIKVIEEKLKPEDKDIAELEYVLKYFEVSEEQRVKMREPIITLDLIKRVISDAPMIIVDFGRKDDEEEACYESQEAY